jgi:hypothetical protein
LIKRLTDSDAARVRKLLETEELGDRTPTQFWRHLKQLASNSVDNKFLIEMWQNRLPRQTQRILMCISDRNMPKLAKIADQIHAIPVEKGYIAASSTKAPITVVTPDVITMIYEQIKKLQMQMNKLIEKSRISRDLSRRRMRSQSRGRSNLRNPDLCWYHEKFGASATKCRSPCKWKSAENGQDR